MSSNSRLTRREALAAIVPVGFAVAQLSVPGCTKFLAENKQGEGEEASEHLRGIIKGLPDIDPSIGVKVSETLVAGSEKLLVVVRYGHTSEQALQFAGDKARKTLLESREQSVSLLKTLSNYLQVTSLTGDGLLPKDAEEINRAIKYLETTKAQLGELVEFSSVSEALTTLAQTRDSLPEGNPQRVAAEKLIGVLNNNSERFGRVLKTFGDTKRVIAQYTEEDPIVRVAHENGYTLISTESPELHAKVLQEAFGAHDNGVIFRLNEEREDAILDAVAQSERTVTILCMGAMHRFRYNALRRSELPTSQRISVIEYNPSALPDDIEELLKAMSR